MAPPPDLKVNYDLLQQSSKTLASLCREFANCEAQERVYDGEWGSGDIKSAMDAFTDNWHYHRGKLLDSMQSLGKMIDQSLATFRKTDARLAASVTGKQK